MTLFELWFSQGTCPVVELLGRMVTKLSEEPLTHFPKWLHHSTFPAAIYEGSDFSIPSPTLVTMPFDHRLPSGYEATSHCGFDLHFFDS